VSDKTNFDKWLRGQPQKYQNEFLGKTKAELFRNGEKLDRFVDPLGKQYTIKELYQLDKNSFKSAGIAKPK